MRQIGVLLETSERVSLLQIDSAGVCLVFAGYHAEERGFARTVDTDYAYSVAIVEGEGHVLQYNVSSKGQIEIGNR